jgi:hypothetical protein
VHVFQSIVTLTNSTVTLSPHSNSDVYVVDSLVNLELLSNIQNSNLFFERTILRGADVFYSDFFMYGNVSFEGKLWQWLSSNVTRNYNIIVADINYNPMENVALTLFGKDSTPVWNGMTDILGRADFNLTFTDNNCTDTLRLEAFKGNLSATVSISFLSDTPIILTLGAHDIATTDVALSKTVVGQGYTMYIMVTVENQGDFTETFNVTAYYNQTAIMIEQWPDGANSQIFWSMGDVNRDGYIDNWDVYETTQAFNTRPGNPRWNPDFDINSDGIVNMKDISTCIQNFGKDIWTFLGLPKLIENQRIVTLPSGNSSIITFRWNTTGVVEGNYTISAYAWPVPGETDMVDNTSIDGVIYVGIPGDINGDGIVDIYDAIKLAGAINSKLYDPIWNANADINSDANVDIYDAIILAGNYGKTA